VHERSDDTAPEPVTMTLEAFRLSLAGRLADLREGGLQVFAFVDVGDDGSVVVRLNKPGRQAFLLLAVTETMPLPAHVESTPGWLCDGADCGQFSDTCGPQLYACTDAACGWVGPVTDLPWRDQPGGWRPGMAGSEPFTILHAAWAAGMNLDTEELVAAAGKSALFLPSAASPARCPTCASAATQVAPRSCEWCSAAPVTATSMVICHECGAVVGQRIASPPDEQEADAHALHA